MRNSFLVIAFVVALTLLVLSQAHSFETPAAPNFGVAGAISQPGVTADFQLAGARPGLRLIGFAVKNTSATAKAAIILRNGSDANTIKGTIPINLAPDESAREWWFPGVEYDNGIFVDWISGTVDVTVFKMER